MSAPQHKASEEKSKTRRQKRKALRNQKKGDSPTTSYKLQRCWFMGLGLVGGVGFVASQVGFAYAEGDFLLNDYAGDSANANFSVSDTTFSASGSLANPEFNPAPAAALPDTFVHAPAAPAVVAETFRYPEPAAEPEAYVPPYEVKPAPVAAPAVIPEPVAAPAPASSPAPAVAEAPSIRIEIEEAKPLAPEVTEVAPPAFSLAASAKKPAARKAARRRNALMGLMAAPLSSYMGNTAVAAELPVTAQTAATVSVVEIANSRTGTLVAVDAVPDIAPEAVPEAAPVVPEILPAPEVAAPPVVELPAAQPIEPPIQQPAVVEEAPIQPTEIVPAALPEGSSLPEEYNSIFVDPTDYSVGATQSPEVIISEQSTGCEFTVGAGQGVPNGACGTGVAPAPAPLGAPEYERAPVASAPATPAQGYYEAPVASAPAVNVGPVSFSTAGIRFNSSTTAAGREYLNRSVRPMVNLQAAEQFIFPLAIPSPITSLFGFRVHPVTGTQRFHAGTDLGAEYGTPVLATQDGTVVSADYAGGYGLMVVLNHDVEDTQLESRYAHLSDITVEPGSTVKKGDVIGLVGSTGVSTGPHLHFEMLQNTADGWVLVNADSLVQNSLTKLVKALNSPMQAMNFSLADLNLNLGSIRRTPVPTEPGSATVELPQPGQDGVSFRPAQPNAS